MFQYSKSIPLGLTTENNIKLYLSSILNRTLEPDEDINVSNTC